MINIEKELLDTIWMTFCICLVLLMQGGFCCLESGLIRVKNSINVAIKNFVDICVTTLIFWPVGFGIMHGSSFNGWFGQTYFFFDGIDSSWLISFFTFQMLFCGTAVTIISGPVAERMRFSGYVLVSVFVAVFIYPFIGHWLWGGVAFGHPVGWIAEKGFLDFAGSTVVHSTGGWVALAAVLIIGPRSGRFDNEKNPIEGHSLILATIGVFLMWVGWFGFNGGSALGVNHHTPTIIFNTLLAGSLGAMVALALSWKIHKRPSVEIIINGCLAGLVSITASCNIMGPWQTILIAFIGSCICFVALIWFEKLKIDDAVGGVPVHCFPGVWGTLAVAILGDPNSWGTGLTRWEQLLVQLEGVFVCFFWAFGLGYLFIWLINRWIPLRISLEEEKLGMNIVEHGASNALLNLLNKMEMQRDKGDFSAPVEVEPHTEVGLIADQYNRVLNKVTVQEEELKRGKKGLEEEISWRKATELQLAEAKIKAESANQAKSVFLANMSHEIRTPMNAILGYAQILMRDKKVTDQQAQAVKTISKSGANLLELINDVLDISKIEAGQMILNPLSFDLKELIDGLKDMFQEACKKKKLFWKVESVDGPIQVYGDSGKVRQILVNLIGNAVKFTDAGGVYFKVERIGADQYRFSIKDTGKGIPLEAQSSIFQAFHQDTEGHHKGGTGLGLAISKKQSEMMQGELTVESTVGAGATFSLVLPLPPAKGEIQTRNTRREVVRLKAGHEVKVLVADDIEENRLLLSKFLTDVGMEVIMAENGKEALEHFRENRPDIIFIDIRMPIMGGDDAIRQLRKEFPEDELKIVVVSASVLSHEVEKYKALGCSEVICKPFRMEEIYSSVKNLLGIEYEYESKEDEKKVVPTLTRVDYSKVCFPKERIAQLEEVVQIASVSEIDKIVKDLKPTNDDERAVLDKLIHLLEQYETEEMMKVLDAIKNVS